MYYIRNKVKAAMATTMPATGSTSLADHRIIVQKATFDELEQRYSSTPVNINDSSRDLSVASTVDIDNTHPYLTRNADRYAHESFDSASSPTFVDVKRPPSPQFKEGQR